MIAAALLRVDDFVGGKGGGERGLEAAGEE